jgi:RNA polymerase sigma factor (sigma-70 family)
MTDDQQWLADRFEEQRPRLRAVAYRTLGSLSEADDAVQEAWLRLSRTGGSEIENLGGWLTTAVARVSLNMLRSRAARREEPLGPHLPDPIVSRVDGTNPEHEALLANSVGLALLVVLDTLAPLERLAFVLHDMFGVPFDEIAPIIDRSPQAARQLASRARRRVQAANAVSEGDLDAQREAIDAFLAAVRAGDFEALVAVLKPRRCSQSRLTHALSGGVHRLLRSGAHGEHCAGRIGEQRRGDKAWPPIGIGDDR